MGVKRACFNPSHCGPPDRTRTKPAHERDRAAPLTWRIDLQIACYQRVVVPIERPEALASGCTTSAVPLPSSSGAESQR